MYIYEMLPIDFWDGVPKASEEETKMILELMPDIPQSGDVYYSYVPNSNEANELSKIYYCKGENNGTAYVFSHYELPKFNYCFERHAEGFPF